MTVRVTSVKSYCLKLGSPEPYLGAPPAASEEHQYFVRPPWASLYSARFETLLVRVQAGNDVGWGEALAPVGPEVPKAIVDHLLAPALLDADASAPRPTSRRLAALMRERGHLVGHQADALAACDIALWDLSGRVTGLPIAQLLGGAFRTSVPTYVSGLPRPTDQERVELAREWVDKGATRVKLALGLGVDQDLATFDAIAGACPSLSIALDAHWAYTLAQAEQLGAGLDQRRAWFLEAPLDPEDVEAHRELAARLTTPIAIGESLRNRYEFSHWLSRRAMDICQPDVARTGITEAAAVADLAQAHHVRVAPHHSVGLGVALAAGLQFAASIDNLEVFEFQPSTLPQANRVLRSGLALQGSELMVPPGSGLGVEVDEEAVEKLAEECR